jgi:benzoylformate decarboxylase/acetolactate synthase-1/2/3 large subunit
VSVRRDLPAHAGPSKETQLSIARYGSDVVVDVLQALGVRYVAFNPGASFRGLHDSLVNYAAGTPAILEVPHEKIAVGIAHGYAKATGEPMGVVTHDLVGLLHATLGIYYAHVDRTPIMVLGGTGPMDAARRRPWIDWVHSANVENSAVRDYTKWDDHPASVEALPDSLVRAYQVSMMQPAGPVYVALDAAVQEEPLGDRKIPVTRVGPPPTRIAPDAEALERVAQALVHARRPAVIAGYLARDPKAWDQLIELAELLAIAVVDTGLRLNFPTEHELNSRPGDVLPDADLVLLLDVKDIGDHTGLLTKEARGGRPALAPDAKLMEIGFGDLGLSSWAADFGSWYQPDERVLADPAVALPLLLERCRELVAAQPHASEGRAPRRRDVARLHATARQAWRDQADRQTGEGELPTVANLVKAVGAAISEHDWTLTAGTGNDWASRLWNFDRPYRHVGRSLGTATQIGISLGVALAYRDTGKLVVDLQPDGDLLFDAGALWVASRHRLPMLVVMVNNRAYNNDWTHQRSVARTRGNPVERAGVGIVIDDPAPDFATLARAFDWHSQGPITRTDEIGPAVARAARVVLEERRPALVDIVCQADHGES